MHTTLDAGIKLLGRVQAGFPTPAEENLLDTITLDSYMVRNRDASFMMQVSSDSMSDAGILAGDLVIVERGVEAKPGMMVVIVYNGTWILRYLCTRTRMGVSELYLKAANNDITPLTQPITAVVRGLVRKYR